MSSNKTLDKTIELKHLETYNNKRLALGVKREDLRRKMVANPFRAVRFQQAKRMRKIRPSKQAADDVAELAGKGAYYSRRLRHIAHQLVRNNTYPDKKQGQNAAHFSHFDNPEVKANLRRWKSGLVPETEGGWSKNVGVSCSSRRAHGDAHSNTGQPRQASTICE